jgi:hypothetical protein
MSISSNSVIHYTSKLENLKGILKESGFKLKYCSELVTLNNNYSLPMATPMVCFCDIPLSEVKNHIDSYGSYGIGLYKTWAKRSGLNPVLYLEKESEISKLVEAQVKRLIELQEKASSDKILQQTILNIAQYCKNYEGPLKHGKIDNENYRFYDEREWRYIPNIEAIGDAPLIIHGDKYNKNKDSFNEKIRDKYLKFEISDISYIIVNDDEDIPEILSIINSDYEEKCTARQLKVLGTKIITKNQIFNDF